MKRKTNSPGLTSPKGGNRACLCDDGSYSKECCDGNIWGQGIGSITYDGQADYSRADYDPTDYATD